MSKRTLLYMGYMLCFPVMLMAGFGCSAGNPTMPANPGNSSLQAQDSKDSSGSRFLWGEYQLTLTDQYGPNGELTGVDVSSSPLRTGELHVNVTSFVQPPNISFHVESVHVDGAYIYVQVTVQLKNPTTLTGYDVRGIVYPPDESTVWMRNWPDKKSAMDGLTTLWPEPGNPLGKNPYMAFYDKASPGNRSFPPQATYGTTYWFKKTTSFKLTSLKYKIDASYPTNALEPVDAYIYDLTANDHIYVQGSHATILAQLIDWQNNIDTVTLDLTSFGLTALEPMAKISENLTNNTSLWQYDLTAGAGVPVGLRTVRLAATTPDDPLNLKYYKDFELPVTYDNDPPVWLDPDHVGIYDHVSGPQFLYLFYYEAWDISGVQYIFYGNDQSSPFDGSVLKVETDLTYNGYTPFGGYDNQLRYYGIRLSDTASHEDDNMLEYTATRYTANARWSFIKGQPPGQDGIIGAPAIGDVNGDGMKDIVVGARDTRIYVYGGNGTGTQNTVIWEQPTGGEIQSTPALVDLNGDHKLDVVVGSDDCNVYALNGATGLPLWTYDAGSGFLMHGSPAIAQMNSGAYDVLIGTGGGTMLALNGEDGSLIWDYPATAGIAGSPGVVDVNGDGIPDVCFGAYDQFIHMVDGATGDALWTYYLGSGMNNIDCSPAMVDVNGDSVPDCIFGARKGSSGILIALDGASDGPTANEIWTQDQLWGNMRRSPAPVKLNGDDVWDFVITSYQTEEFSIYAINGANGAVLYHRLGPDVVPTDPFNYSSPIVGDFTGDGHLDAIYGRQDGYCDIVNLDGFELPGDFAGRNLMKMQVSTGNKQEIYGTPAVEDVDGDGEWELIACNMRGYTYILDLHAPVPTDIALRGWTVNQGNRWNTGVPEFTPPDE